METSVETLSLADRHPVDEGMETAPSEMPPATVPGLLSAAWGAAVGYIELGQLCSQGIELGQLCSRGSLLVSFCLSWTRLIESCSSQQPFGKTYWRFCICAWPCVEVDVILSWCFLYEFLGISFRYQVEFLLTAECIFAFRLWIIFNAAQALKPPCTN